MSYQALFLSFDNANVRTFSKYPNFFHKNFQTFLHFVCKYLKIKILQKQNFSYLYIPQIGKISPPNIRTLGMVQNMPLFRFLMYLFCAQNIK